MTAPRDLEQLVADWLMEDAHQMTTPSSTLAHSLQRVVSTGQERYATQRLFGDRAGRAPAVRSLAYAGAIVGTAVAVALAASLAFGTPPAVVAPSPAPSPTTAPSPSIALAPVHAGAFVPGPTLTAEHWDLHSILLPDARVLFAGPSDHGTSLEVWTPGDAAAVALPDPAVPGGATATLLADGRVLIVGSTGETPAAAMIWDSRDSTATSVGLLRDERSFAHSAVRLADGRVLVTGGYGSADPVTFDRPVLSTAEIFDPATGTFAATGSLGSRRANHASTLLPDGSVLVTAGLAPGCDGVDAERWDPATGRFSALELALPEASPTVTLLEDGRLLVVGQDFGDPGTHASAAIWDPQTGGLSSTGHPVDGLGQHTATRLADGRVLLVHGSTGTAEVWDPASGEFVRSGDLPAHGAWNTATLLQDGRVLVASGSERGQHLDITQIWDPELDASVGPNASSPPAPTVDPSWTPSPPPLPEVTETGQAQPSPSCT